MRTAPTAVVLVAHGAPGVLPSFQVLANGLEARGVADRAAVAFLRGEPSLRSVVSELPEHRLVAVPLLTSEGYYSRVVLPEAIGALGRPVATTIPVGAHPQVPEIIAERVAATLVTGRLGRDAQVCVVGHGTRRHPTSRNTTLAVVAALTARGVPTVPAFLDDDPPIESVAELGRTGPLLVVPFLIGSGPHLLADLPQRLGLGDQPGSRRIVIDRPFGEYPEVAGLIEDLVRSELGDRGAVHLVGAGPGDPGLITVRGLRLLRAADVVIYDRLVSPELLGEARVDAELIDGGHRPGGATTRQDRINDLLVEHARAGRLVVRLKGGDPYVFGRGWEELSACRAAGVKCEVVPGISSAIAVPAAAGVPVTTRGVARSMAVVTGRTEEDTGLPDEQIEALARIDTVVLLMGFAALGDFTRRLIAAGRAPDTPVTCIERGTLPEQRICCADLATIAGQVEAAGLGSPMVTVIGAVAGLNNLEPVLAASGAGAEQRPW